MPSTTEPTAELAAEAKAHVERSSARLAHLFSFVPDEKLAWTPSPTAKSAVGIVAHCALTSRLFAELIAGRGPERMPSPEEFFKGLHEGEARITTRGGALSLLGETTAELLAALGAVSAESMDSSPDSPFGPMPMTFWMGESGQHLAVHAGQLAYLQTIWGDLDNHMG